MTTALLLLVLTLDPNTLHYMAPDAEPQPAPDKFQLSEWKKGSTLYVATDEANFREKPDANAKVLHTLPFGAKVVVQSVATPPVRVSDRVDRWYQVAVGRETGFVFGNVLTPFLFEDDFDADGDKELASVAFTADYKIRVRVLDKSAPKEKQLSSVDLDPYGGGYLSVKGGNAEAKLLPASKAGLPLIQVTSRMEACADYGDYFVSYLGKPRVALNVTGLTDPPNMSSYSVKFDPKKKTAVVTRTNTEATDDGKETTTRTKKSFTLKDGIYVDGNGKPAQP